MPEAVPEDSVISTVVVSPATTFALEVEYLLPCLTWRDLVPGRRGPKLATPSGLVIAFLSSEPDVARR